MRRIDLICKLLGPFVIGIVDGISTEAAILVNLGMNCISVIIEYFSIAKVKRRSSLIWNASAYNFRFMIKFPDFSSRSRRPNIKFKTIQKADVLGENWHHRNKH